MTATDTTTRPAAGAGAPRRGGRRTRLGDGLSPMRAVPMLPAALLLLGFMLGPILYSLYLAFTDSAIRGDGASDTSFVGVQNFIDAFADGDFWNSVVLTLVFTLISAVLGQNLLGMGLALLMERSHRLVTFAVTSIVIAAWILPEVVAGYLLYTFFADEGSLNTLLGAVGLPAQDLLFSAPILAVSFANIWRGTAFSMLVYSAALSSVPADVYESAALDGAGRWRRLVSITLPQLAPTTVLVLVLQMLASLKVFDQIYQMTDGGPGGDTRPILLYVYEVGFTGYRLGYASAISYIFFFLIIIVSIAYMVISSRRSVKA